jgi:hypothetical protein
METAETAMEMAPGALPHPGRVPEQRLLSPKICLRQQRHCGTVLKISLIVLGFSVGRLFIGEGASSGGDQGGHTIGGRDQGLDRAPCCVGSPWPPSSSCSVFGPLPGKIRLLELVSSNSKNMSCVAFLKHKNSRKQGTGTVASC